MSAQITETRGTNAADCLSDAIDDISDAKSRLFTAIDASNDDDYLSALEQIEDLADDLAAKAQSERDDVLRIRAVRWRKENPGVEPEQEPEGAEE